jgi:hypothetical protein
MSSTFTNVSFNHKGHAEGEDFFVSLRAPRDLCEGDNAGTARSAPCYWRSISPRPWLTATAFSCFNLGMILAT